MPLPPPPASLRRSRRCLALALAAVALATLATQPGPAHAAAPLAPRWNHADRLDSPDGYAQLAWGLPAADGQPASGVGWVYQLQESHGPDFEAADVQYQGSQQSCFVSGLQDGNYSYRVRARPPGEERWGPWSSVARVQVQHHDRRLALALMGLGAIVFLTTASFLIRHRNDPVPDALAAGRRA